jgi:hypothetical protein
MGYSRTSYNNRPKAGVYAYLTALAVTTVTTADTFVPILGTFDNDPFEGFYFGATAIVYDGASCWFEIDWHATLESQDADRIVHVGISKSGATILVTDPSAMGVYHKYAGEPLPLSGTQVVLLEAGDTIQLQLTSDTNADQVTVHHFTTTIKRFFN